MFDYVLTITREVELVWMRPRSILSALFIVTRYLGLAMVLIDGLWAGIGVTVISSSVCFIVTYQLRFWAQLVWTTLTHITSILCVAATFSNPKKVKWTLMILWSLVVIVEIVCDVLAFGPPYGFSVLNTNAYGGVDLCTVVDGRYFNLFVDSAFGVLAFDILLMVVVVYRSVSNSIEMRKMLGKRKMNEYVKLLVQHNTLYFTYIVIINTASAVIQFASYAPLWLMCWSLPLKYAFPYVFYPRIVLNFRGHRAASDGVYAYGGSHSLPWNVRSGSGSESESQPQSQPQQYIPLQPSRLSRSSGGQTKNSGDLDESSVYVEG